MEIVDSAAPGPTVWSTDNGQEALQKLQLLEGFATPCVVFLTAFARSIIVYQIPLILSTDDPVDWRRSRITLHILYIIYTVYKLHNICRCFFKTDRYAFLFWLSIEQAHHS